MNRPPVDLVVPFRGPLAERDALRTRLERLHRQPGDTLTIVENTPGRPATPTGGPVRIHPVPAPHTPGHARNAGATTGHADWIAFIDADTDPGPGLLDRLFDPPPASTTGLIAGGVIDEPVPPDAPPAARYAYLRRTLHQDRSLGMDSFAFATGANLACRRAPFDAIGGFREDIRSGEDADLSYRLHRAGWQIERREAAFVVHRSRRTVRGLVAQAALHGSGADWIDRHYPGAFPARRLRGLAWWGVRSAAAATLRFARTRERDALLRGLLDPVWELAFELGRRRPAVVDPPSAHTPAGTLRRR